MQKHGVTMKHQVGLPPLMLGIIQFHGFEKLLNDVTVQEVFTEVPKPEKVEPVSDARRRKLEKQQASSPETETPTPRAETPPQG